MRQENVLSLIQDGFVYEAMIDRYYLGSDCYFLVKYFTDDRRNSEHWDQEDQMIMNLLALQKQLKVQNPPKGYELRKADVSDADLLASLYRTVFNIYPTPMNDPSYIKKCMKESDHFLYIYV